MLRALWLLVLVVIAVPASAQEYQSKELADAASGYRQELIDSIPAAKTERNYTAVRITTLQFVKHRRQQS